MNKKEYTGADIEVVLFKFADVITASGTTALDDDELVPMPANGSKSANGGTLF